MKKIVFLAATALSLFVASCNSCGNKQQGFVIETETDSIFMPNDSTVADLQTFVYEGLMPMDNGTIADYTLTIKSLGMDENGTYTILSTFMSDTSLIKQKDNGQSIVIIGMPNDTTAVIYQLVSANNYPTINLMSHGDTALSKLDSRMRPVSKDSKHKLIRKK
jgi:copper homeostasis protein (lipoprotein)